MTSTKVDTWGHANALIEFKDVVINRSDLGLTWNKTLTGETFLVGDQVKIEGTVQIQPASAITVISRLRIPDTPVIREREREFRGETPPRQSKNTVPEKQQLTGSTAPPPRPSLGQKEHAYIIKNSADISLNSPSLSVVHFWKSWKNVLAMFFIGFLGFCSSIIVSIYAKGKLAHWFGDKYEETKWTGLLGDALAITIIFLYALSFYQLGWGD